MDKKIFKKQETLQVPSSVSTTLDIFIPPSWFLLYLHANHPSDYFVLNDVVKKVISLHLHTISTVFT